MANKNAVVQFLAEQVRNSPDSVLEIDANALKALGSDIDAKVVGRLKSTSGTTPSLNCIEFLMDYEPEWEFEIKSRECAESLARQLPVYTRLAPTCDRALTVKKCVSALVKYDLVNKGGGQLTSALSGFAGWPVLYQDVVIGALEKEPELGNEGRIVQSAILGRGVTAKDSGVYTATMRELQDSKEAKAVLDTAPSAKVVAMFAPRPSDNLGNALIKSAIACILPLKASSSAKAEMIDEVGTAASDAKLFGKKGGLSNYASAILSADSKNVVEAAKRLAKALVTPSPMSHLFQPKERQKSKRDFLLIRSPEGKILCSKVEVKKSEKQDLKVHVSEPQPLLEPSTDLPKKAMNPSSAPSVQSLLLGLIDKKLAVAGKKGIEPKPALLKKVIPHDKFKGIASSLKGGLVAERKSEEIDILLI